MTPLPRTGVAGTTLYRMVVPKASLHGGITPVPGANVVAANGLALVPGAIVATAGGIAPVPGASVVAACGLALVPGANGVKDLQLLVAVGRTSVARCSWPARRLL
jgi:hypothetical protein